MDYGGVLTTSMGRAFAEFCAETGVNPDAFKQVIQEAYGGRDHDGIVARLETGRAEVEEFETWLAERLSAGLPAPIEAAGLRDRLFSRMLPDDAMIEAVARVRRSGRLTALLSNSWGASRYERDRFPELFDAVVVSGDVGLRKPDPQIFRHAAEQLGVQPGECVFVDDLLQNVEAARGVGMEGIVHRSAEFTIPRLEALLGVRLS